MTPQTGWIHDRPKAPELDLDTLPTTAAGLAEVLVDILVEIGNLSDQATDLSDTYQPGLGFLSFQAKQALDQQTRAERRSWAEALSGLGFAEALGLGRLKQMGESPTPGNFRSLAVETEFTFTLLHAARKLAQSLHREGKQLQIPTIGREPTDAELLAHVKALVPLTANVALLTTLARDLHALHESAHALVHGNDRILLQDPCPFCRNQSLVVYFADDLIKCDRDVLTGQKAACTCPDPLCDCKQKPVAHRHIWYRSPLDKRKKPTDGTWSSLAGRLKFLRNAAAQTTDTTTTTT